METKSETTISTNSLMSGLSPEHLQRLLIASRSLSSTLDLQEVLERVLDAAAELTDSDGASILLIDHKTGDLRFVAIKGSNELVNVVVPKNGSIAGWVVTHNEPIIAQNAQTDERHYSTVQETIGQTIDSVLAVPLRHKGEILGVLEAVNKKDNQLYTNYDIAVAQSLSSQAAVAIANARLFNQSDAIADMMHELKTPLMALTTATEMLERDDLPEGDRKILLQTVRGEIKRLTKMTQNFLELSRLDSGRITLEPISVQPVELATVSIQTMESQAESNNITLNLDNQLPEKFSNITIYGDLFRLQQVLINLISNGIKYNKPNGDVTLAIKHLPTTNEVMIEVADTGLGISHEDLPHLFDRFYRIKNSNNSEGTGLGLSITKKIIEAHNGRLVVKSEIGKGSRFQSIFPVEK
ncbi:MAG: ATP-binding protein [Chloroflexota bacterium]